MFLPSSKGQALAPQLPLLPQLWCPSRSWTQVGTTEHQPPRRHQRVLSDAFCSSHFLLFSLQPERAKPKRIPWITAAASTFTPAAPPRITSSITSQVRSGLCSTRHTQLSSASLRGLAAPPDPLAQQDCSSWQVLVSKGCPIAPGCPRALTGL